MEHYSGPFQKYYPKIHENFQINHFTYKYRIAEKFGGKKVRRIWQIMSDSPN